MLPPLLACLSQLAVVTGSWLAVMLESRFAVMPDSWFALMSESQLGPLDGSGWHSLASQLLASWLTETFHYQLLSLGSVSRV